MLRSSARVHHQQALRITIARAQEGPGAGKQIREFREDTGEVTVPGQDKQQKGADGTLYADQVSMVSEHALLCLACAFPATRKAALVLCVALYVAGSHHRFQLGLPTSVVCACVCFAAQEATRQPVQGDEAAAEAGILWLGWSRKHGECCCGWWGWGWGWEGDAGGAMGD